MKIIDLLNAQESISKFYKREHSMKAAYALIKNIKKINAEIEDFTKAREEIAKRLGTLEGDKYVFGDNQVEWEKQIADLLNEEADYVPYTISIEELEKSGKILPEDLFPIDWLIKDDDK